MDIRTILFAIISAFGFALWPILGKKSGAPGAWLITLVSLSTLLTACIASIKDYRSVESPNFKAVLLLLLAGAFNGLSCYVYSVRIDHLDPSKVAAFVAIVVVGITMFTPIFHFFLNHSTPDRNQCIGYVLAALSIYFLIK